MYEKLNEDYMEKRRISVFNYKEGDILATDLVNEYGVLIAVKNTEMNSFIKDKLIEHGILDIYVINQESSYQQQMEANQELNAFYQEYKISVASLKNILTKLVSGERIEVTEINNIVQMMTSKIENVSTIIQCINNIKIVDEYTYYHSFNTAFYAMLVGKWLKLSENDLYKVIQAGLLHDIGKIAISEEIINKEGALTNEEYERMKQHTILGYSELQEFEDIDLEVKRATLLHHERVNHSGYPLNASPESIGLFARIIAVADVYDAMTSDRVYKKRSTPFDAFSMFLSVGVGLFDTTILFRFIKNIATYYVGMKVLLSNGEIGKIVYIPPQDLASPIVQTETGYIELWYGRELSIVAML